MQLSGARLITPRTAPDRLLGSFVLSLGQQPPGRLRQEELHGQEAGDEGGQHPLQVLHVGYEEDEEGQQHVAQGPEESAGEGVDDGAPARGGVLHHVDRDARVHGEGGGAHEEARHRPQGEVVGEAADDCGHQQLPGQRGRISYITRGDNFPTNIGVTRAHLR